MMVMQHRSFCAPPSESAAVSASASTSLGSTTFSEANSYINLGQFETMGVDQGRMAMGIAYLEDQCQLLDRELTDEADPRKRSAKVFALAQKRLEVGRQHHQQQDAEQAISHYKQALDIIQAGINDRKDGDDIASKKAVRYASFIMSEICSALGVAYNDIGRKEEADTMLNHTLSLRKAMVGKDHPSVAECLNNLGAIHFGRENYQKSVEYYEQALELLTNASGGSEEGPFVGLIYYNIGLCRGHLGHVQAAVAALRKALKIAENALGMDHPQVTLIRDTIAQATGGGPSAPKPPEEEQHAKAE
jgi:tetratricopeptide (TPR) repeat protein